MEQLKARLGNPDVRGIVRSAKGEIREFHEKGVKDLFNLVTEEQGFLKDAIIADRVIGRGAALLLVLGGVKEVFAYVMSETAHDTLVAAGIKTSYSTLQPNILNRTGTGICPVEQLTMQTSSPQEAYSLIKQFLKNK